MERMDVTNISLAEIAKMFVEYINHEDLNTLINTYKDDVTLENSGIIIGKFRLIHIVDPITNTYLTFTAHFYNDTPKQLVVHNVEKNAFILECTYDPEQHSWTSNRYFENIPVSSIGDMARRLKSILN